MKRRDEFYKSAEEAYLRALDTDQQFSLADRGLGLVYLRRGENEAATEKLGKYLSTEKNAWDRQYITNLLRTIRQ